MSGSDRDIQAWEMRLKQQAVRGWDNYVRRRIDLSSARAAEYWGIAGEFFYVEQVSSESAKASISINRNTNDQIDLELGTVIKTIFTELYVTNTVQTDQWIDIIIGINFEYYKKSQGVMGDEVQQVLNLTHANPDTDVAAAANPCNRALIKADVNNTQTAWIDFGVAAVQINCMPLDAGEWIEVSISNTDQVHANFEVGGEIVFIAYEV